MSTTPSAPPPSAPALSVPYGPAASEPVTAPVTAPGLSGLSGRSERSAARTAAKIGFRVALPFLIRAVFRAISKR